MYTSVDNVKNMVGKTNLPSLVSDSQIQVFISDGDAFIDSFTGSTWSTSYSTTAEDSGVDRKIRAVSNLLGASLVLKRMAGEITAGIDFAVGQISKKKSMQQSSWLRMANNYIEMAKMMLSSIDPNVDIKITNQ